MTTTFLEDFTTVAHAAEAAEPAWLGERRREAMERFSALGFPTTRDEDWHFTSVAPIAERQFHPASPDARVSVTRLAPFTVGARDWHSVVVVNGHVAPDRSRLAALPRGVRVMDLATAWLEAPALLEAHLARIAAWRTQAFTALNTAFLRDAVVVHAAPGVVLERPLHILFVSDGEDGDAVSHPRVLIVAETGAELSVVESYASPGKEAYFTNAITEVEVGDGATVTHYKVQRENARAFHVGTVQARQGRDSHFISFSIATGAALSRTNIYTLLGGAGSGATLHGLYMADGEQHMDHQTSIEHAEPDCFSREVYKGILDGRSHGVFNGKVYVHAAAQKTDGKQSNNNLLLSPHAQVDTKPQLEIFADDVKCTHGATVGRLDETALFYLRSRGVGAEAARSLLTYAFAASVLEEIPLEPLRDALEALARRRFTSA